MTNHYKPKAAGGQMKRLVMYACFIVAFIAVVLGRVNSFNMTEGEAFVYCWRYWVVAICLTLIGLFIGNKYT